LLDFSDGGVDAMLGVDENILAPDSRDDLVAGDELALALHQEREDLHGDFLQLEDTNSPAQLVTAAVEFEFGEPRYPRWHTQGPL